MTQETPVDGLTVARSRSDSASRCARFTTMTKSVVDPESTCGLGYRVYTSADLTRLSQVIVYRRLELPLDEIARLLDEGNAVSHLVRQRERVMARLDEMKDLVEAIDLALEKAMTNTP
ncbi:merR HTH regulatory family protein [Mycobacterium ulcerans str. Harvey]|uniref:MerR HTH regulatory family protein n=1 Tax=Mycobacterium ulcerans str. Harvey TaxID=1299332 RepID=A0ABN0R9K6_MYCUL|nr:merR HTH regulatory family protein [Mycobacterium ulcerans str. Harvey]